MTTVVVVVVCRFPLLLRLTQKMMRLNLQICDWRPLIVRLGARGAVHVDVPRSPAGSQGAELGIKLVGIRENCITEMSVFLIKMTQRGKGRRGPPA
jgi:hypothetical protein